MDNTAHNLQQPHIERTLEYRAHWRGLYFLMVGSTPFIFLSCAILAVSLWSDESLVGVSFAAASFILPVITLIVAKFWLAPVAFTKVLVSQRGITLKYKGHNTELPFFKMVGVRFAFLPYVGGWFTLAMQNGERFSFSVGIERSDYLLDAIAIAQPVLVESAELARYRRASIVMDHVFARLQKTYANWPSLALMQIGLPLFVTVAVAYAFSMSSFADVGFVYAGIGLLNALIGITLWLPLEVIEMRRKNFELVENPLHPLRDMKREQTLKMFARAVHFIVLSGAVAIFLIA